MQKIYVGVLLGRKPRRGCSIRQDRKPKREALWTIIEILDVVLPLSYVVRINNADSNCNRLFARPLAPYIPGNARARCDEIEAFADPVIEIQHRTISPIQEMFRALLLVPAFKIVVLNTATTLYPAPPEELPAEMSTVHQFSSLPISLNIIIRKPCATRIMSDVLRTLHGFGTHIAECVNTAWWGLFLSRF